MNFQGGARIVRTHGIVSWRRSEAKQKSATLFVQPITFRAGPRRSVQESGFIRRMWTDWGTFVCAPQADEPLVFDHRWFFWGVSAVATNKHGDDLESGALIPANAA